MKCPKILAALLGCAVLASVPVVPAHAAINSMSLGASYNAQQTSITFRVYSSTATRVVVYLYSAGYGVQESATYTLSPAGMRISDARMSGTAYGTVILHTAPEAAAGECCRRHGRLRRLRK